jgi:hypothetical protein
MFINKKLKKNWFFFEKYIFFNFEFFNWFLFYFILFCQWGSWPYASVTEKKLLHTSPLDRKNKELMYKV